MNESAISESWAELKEPVRDGESAWDYQQQRPVTTCKSPGQVEETVFPDQMRAQSHDRDIVTARKQETTGKKYPEFFLLLSVYFLLCLQWPTPSEPEDSAVFEDQNLPFYWPRPHIRAKTGSKLIVGFTNAWPTKIRKEKSLSKIRTSKPRKPESQSSMYEESTSCD